MGGQIVVADALVHKLAELKGKQEALEKAWKKRAGNRHLLQFFVDIMPKVLDAERCSIFVLDPFRDNVWVHCGTGLNEKEVLVPISGSIVGRTIATGRTVIEHDVQETVGTHDLVAAHTGFVTHSALCVPVHGVTRKQVMGAIQVLNKKPPLRFNNSDVQTLERLAVLLQLQIENVFVRQELALMLTEMKKQVDQLEKQVRAP
jgi:signal transduction protein with GAF and PtsI domain